MNMGTLGTLWCLHGNVRESCLQNAASCSCRFASAPDRPFTLLWSCWLDFDLLTESLGCIGTVGAFGCRGFDHSLSLVVSFERAAKIVYKSLA
mmetsp:Transcript_6380/g.19703  ORF Transcript_6380/g.19703 Transcript_6380/m.19703 type:complete len:93 (+) Transcript_6380:186-464(+)